MHFFFSHRNNWYYKEQLQRSYLGSPDPLCGHTSMKLHIGAIPMGLSFWDLYWILTLNLAFDLNQSPRCSQCSEKVHEWLLICLIRKWEKSGLSSSDRPLAWAVYSIHGKLRLVCSVSSMASPTWLGVAELCNKQFQSYSTAERSSTGWHPPDQVARWEIRMEVLY